MRTATAFALVLAATATALLFGCEWTTHHGPPECGPLPADCPCAVDVTAGGVCCGSLVCTCSAGHWEMVFCDAPQPDASPPPGICLLPMPEACGCESVIFPGTPELCCAPDTCWCDPATNQWLEVFCAEVDAGLADAATGDAGTADAGD